jgi:cytoskeleton protein RodZ
MAVRKRIADDGPGHDWDNVIEAPMTPRRLTVSEILRNRRTECGLDIGHVAEVLRIRQPILAAIEDGRFDELPGPAYSVGFIRSYATYLGLDADALVARFKTESVGATSRPRLYFPLPVRDSHVPTGPLLLICLLLAVLIYGGWYYVNAGPERLADWVPPVPDRLRHLVGSEQPQQAQPAPAAATQAPAAAPAPAVVAQQPISAPPAAQQSTSPQPVASQPAATAPAPAPVAASQPQPAVDGAPPVESKPSPAPAAPQPSPDLAQPAVSADAAKPAAGTTSYGAQEATRVVLKANADAWIQVRDGNSNLLFTRVLKPGETYNVPNQPGLTLVAGNAGGLDIAVDGMDVPRLGEPGRVVRNVSLDPDRLLGAARHAN